MDHIIYIWYNLVRLMHGGWEECLGFLILLSMMFHKLPSLLLVKNSTNGFICNWELVCSFVFFWWDYARITWHTYRKHWCDKHGDGLMLLPRCMLRVGPLADVAWISWAGQLDASTLCIQYFSLVQLFSNNSTSCSKTFWCSFLVMGLNNPVNVNQTTIILNIENAWVKVC